MVKLQLELTDIDYEFLIREYLPKVQEKLELSGSPLSGLLSGGMAETLLLRSPDSVKDKLAAELINMNAVRLEEQLEGVAQRNGIPGKVRNLRATSSQEE